MPLVWQARYGNGELWPWPLQVHTIHVHVLAATEVQQLQQFTAIFTDLLRGPAVALNPAVALDLELTGTKGKQLQILDFRWPLKK